MDYPTQFSLGITCKECYENLKDTETITFYAYEDFLNFPDIDNIMGSSFMLNLRERKLFKKLN